MATAPVIDIQIPMKEMLRILVIEDDPELGKALAALMEEWGYTADLAEDIPHAEDLLCDNAYQMVIADVVFENGTVEGDEFVLMHEHLMRGAQRVCMTGKGFDRVHRKSELDRLGVPVLKKGDQNFLVELRRVADGKLEERKRHLSAQMRDMLSSRRTSTDSIIESGPLYPRSATMLYKKAEGILLDWLGSKESLDKKGLYYAGTLYSPQMLIDEIEEGTPVGNAHVDMFLDLIKFKLGLGHK
jgi:CheY-like chemotaxis protein